jgi:hypothetical protein
MILCGLNDVDSDVDDIICVCVCVYVCVRYREVLVFIILDDQSINPECKK